MNLIRYGAMLTSVFYVRKKSITSRGKELETKDKEQGQETVDFWRTGEECLYRDKIVYSSKH